MNKQLISIIVPCYNQAQYLDEALQSVLDQTYQQWECIIVNDGSPDNTEEVASKWLEIDDRFKYLYQKNGGLSSARNLGLDNVKGDYIQFLDADDILDCKKLELSLLEYKKVLECNPKVIISTFRMFIDDITSSTEPFSELIQDNFTFQELLYGWDYKFNIPIHCGLFHSSLFTDFKFPVELKAKEDWIMWLSLSQKEVNVFFIDKPLVYYRVHQKSMTKDYKFMQENQIKAIEYLKYIISEKDYKEYLIFALKNKYRETFQLRTSIKNYKNTRTYKISQKIQKTYVAKWFLKFLK